MYVVFVISLQSFSNRSYHLGSGFSQQLSFFFQSDDAHCQFQWFHPRFGSEVENSTSAIQKAWNEVYNAVLLRKFLFNVRCCTSIYEKQEHQSISTSSNMFSTSEVFPNCQNIWMSFLKQQNPEKHDVCSSYFLPLGGWTNPSEKYARQLGSWNPKLSVGENQKKHELPPPTW